ncbi:hypothetical protein [Luteibacter sp. 22Crub2.1]|uniref:hypothetical protein n=1 Tax=Luteibacter sp. 22Crub2.1 TaxID=1283288 RepID=UPI0009D3747E|nr:hypothetical protein [Luteibacter sp. 22Crub2.1]SKB39554.1 hypothetical protein SAMN05660880_00901 [Luteibacter sp. 22Crub2.1]
MPADLIIRSLTYDGSVLHTTINVALLAITTTGNAWAWRARPFRAWLPWLSVFVVMTAIQIGLWFLANAAGISCIWSALAGVALIQWQRTGAQDRASRLALAIAAAAGLVGIALYLVWLPPITTIAHLISAVVGALLYGAVAGRPVAHREFTR